MKRNKLAAALATWFGCGYAPKAPGTAGSVAALAIGWALGDGAGWKPVYFVTLTLAALAPAVWASGVAACESGKKDPQHVVIDEVLGTWLALGGATRLNWKSYVAALVLFRLFDIWKPPPVRQLERLPGGAGIVADDLAAGVYSALVLFTAGCFNLY